VTPDPQAGRDCDAAGREHDRRLEQLRVRLSTGEYRVDPRAVADAIVRRLAERSRPDAPAQNECS
jgi:hypothetical protein